METTPRVLDLLHTWVESLMMRSAEKRVHACRFDKAYDYVGVWKGRCAYIRRLRCSCGQIHEELLHYYQ